MQTGRYVMTYCR